MMFKVQATVLMVITGTATFSRMTRGINKLGMILTLKLCIQNVLRVGVMSSVISPSVVMLGVVSPSVIMLSVYILSLAESP
jgi:hypothetical protein